MTRTLVTGATGFIGKTLSDRLLEYSDRGLRIAIRGETSASVMASGCESVAVGGIGPQTYWGSALVGVDAVVHLAARVHVMADKAVDPLAEFRRVNVAGTLRLAQEAARAGVRRMVYLSSIKVNGEQTPLGKPFTAEETPSPVDPYGLSKLEAEQGLWQLAEESGMEVVIIRPPLVYGPSVKGNFASMMRWIAKGVPLPLGAIDNQRSLVGLDNLVDLIMVCIDHPAAANQVFLAGDGEDLSTTELLRRLAKAMGRPVRLIPVPPRLLMFAAAMLGKGDIARRLLGSLQVDISKPRDVLGWTPPVSVDEGLRRTAIPLLSRLD